MKWKDQFAYRFHDQDLSIFLCEDGKLYLLINDLCQVLGVNARNQLDRLKENELYDDSVEMLERVPTDGGSQNAMGIWIKRFPFWLGIIATLNITDPEIRERVMAYQRELADLANDMCHIREGIHHITIFVDRIQGRSD